MLKIKADMSYMAG